jgi:ABC-2 type transport system ATP-binding protein
MSVIRIDSLTKSFGSLTAVDNLSLAVAEGEIFGLVGPDGAGKTTTLRLLASIMEPTSGNAWIADRHIVKDAEAIKENIGYMSQRFGLYHDLTVMENIDFYADIYGIARKGRKDKVDRLLDFSNLTPFKKRKAGHLSGGMKQKLGLACALVHTPKVLLLDEPTNGVDPVSRREFWRILYQLLREKVTLFVSTAYLDEAERCNRVGLLHKGRLIACGAPDEVKTLIRGKIVEVRSSNSRKAATVLRQAGEVESVNIFGDRLHLMTAEPEMFFHKMKSMLTEAGLEFHGMRQIDPGLEDVFVSVLAQEEK